MTFFCRKKYFIPITSVTSECYTDVKIIQMSEKYTIFISSSLSKNVRDFTAKHVVHNFGKMGRSYMTFPIPI
jgi:hypothetical protein